MRRHRLGQGQRGVVLIVALIMLVALALLSAWAVNTGMTNMRIVGNTQARQEAVAAAQAAVEQTISSTLFMKNPTAVAAAAIPIDIDGDGTGDYDASLSPQPSCYRARIVKTSELDPNRPSDVSCMGSSAAQNSGIEVEGAAAATGDSLCADSDWNVRAVVVDPRSHASVAVNQGISTRALSTDTANACP